VDKIASVTHNASPYQIFRGKDAVMDDMLKPARVWPYRLGALGLIVMAAVLRIVYLATACPLDLAPDEAHYWDWSRHLDWSYYSKGPLIAWMIRASCELFGTSMAAVRLPAVLCGSMLVWGLYVLTARMYSERLALLVAALALPFPLVAAGSTLMTIDAPYTCLWIWAVILGNSAILQGSCWAWPALGVVLGFGILAKYTMVLLVPCLFGFLLFTPGYRQRLLEPGFWIMCVLGALVCSPILIWNATHGWVTLLHTRGHAGLDKPAQIYWLGPLKFVGTQAGLLLGFWFLVWAGAMVRYRPWGRSTPAERYLWWLSAPIFAFFGLMSLKNGGGEPNWPVATYLAGMVLGAGWLMEVMTEAGVVARRWLYAAAGTFAALGLIATVLVHDSRPFHAVLLSITGPATQERPMPLRRIDPTCRLRGWQALARRVDEHRTRLRAEGHDVVLTGTTWNLPGELGFYCEGRPQAYSIGLANGDRHSQYDLWHPNPIDDPGAFAGKTFLIVGDVHPEAQRAFAAPLHRERFEHREGKHVVAAWTISVFPGFRGFPEEVLRKPAGN
jgi:hypothetical protein